MGFKNKLLQVLSNIILNFLICCFCIVAIVGTLILSTFLVTESSEIISLNDYMNNDVVKIQNRNISETITKMIEMDESITVGNRLSGQNGNNSGIDIIDGITFWDKTVDYMTTNEDIETIKYYFCETIAYIPNCILYDYMDRGFRIKIVDDITERFSEYSDDIVGLYIGSENAIYIEYPQLLRSTHTLAHEFGHYVYFRLNIEDDMLKLYTIEQEGLAQVYRDYCKKNESEYFAEYFAVYLAGKINQELFDETRITYEYISGLCERLYKANLIIELF